MLSKDDLEQIQKLLSSVATKQDLQTLNHDIKTIKNDVVSIRRDMKTIVNFFDKEYLELRM